MSALLSAIRARQLEQIQAPALLDALSDTTVERAPRAPRSADGDYARMRGGPMIGDVGGHIPGTRLGNSHGGRHRVDYYHTRRFWP